MLNKIKVSLRRYFSRWDFTRIFRLLLGAGLFTGYFSAGETIYLFGGVIFSLQAILNIGCPGGSCETKTKKSDSPVMEFKKLEADKQQDV
ncbi:MAG: hypothetical protein VB102_10690 [Paludibacter sp.]|nr:hypothetical protein [Paludibacter sp.]